MSTAEGWYDDPSSPGRLRYWDGADWTDWVNENGETRSEPLPPPPGAQAGTASVTEAPSGRPTETDAPIPTDLGPSPGVQPAPSWDDQPAPADDRAAQPAPAWASDSGPAATSVAGDAPTPLQRMGYLAMAAGGVVTLASIGQEMTRGLESSGGSLVYKTGVGTIGAGLLLIAAGALGAFVRNGIARVVALIAGVAALILIFGGLLASRANNFVVDSAIEIKSGWWILFAGGAIALVGLTLAMWGTIARRPSGRVLGIILMAVVLFILLSVAITALVTDPSSSWVKPR